MKRRWKGRQGWEHPAAPLLWGRAPHSYPPGEPVYPQTRLHHWGIQAGAALGQAELGAKSGGQGLNFRVGDALTDLEAGGARQRLQRRFTEAASALSGRLVAFLQSKTEQHPLHSTCPSRDAAPQPAHIPKTAHATLPPICNKPPLCRLPPQPPRETRPGPISAGWGFIIY